jgi:predicted DNA-binding protein (UPF0251 family)
MKSKGRPKKKRTIKDDPRILQFSPRGRPGRPDEIELAMDEFEAVRLADFLATNQKRAAHDMHISQQTFSRILKRARRVISDALINGKILKIRGGQYVVKAHQQHLAKAQQETPKPSQEQTEFSFIA